MKGISPLIASVLLVALTVSMFVVIQKWQDPFVKGQVEEISADTSTKIKCQNAGLRTTLGQINSTSKNVSLTAENTGTVDLAVFKFNIILSNGTTVNTDSSPTNITLTPGNKQKFTTLLATSATDPANITSVRLISKCAGSASIYDDLKGSELSKVT